MRTYSAIMWISTCYDQPLESIGRGSLGTVSGMGFDKEAATKTAGEIKDVQFSDCPQIHCIKL